MYNFFWAIITTAAFVVGGPLLVAIFIGMFAVGFILSPWHLLWSIPVGIILLTGIGHFVGQAMDGGF